ncbi:MAG: tRNA 2-thiouridine(34) synthase MnmA [Planctomycetota bacterium]|jgi:tRNA-specific 2-thiouridylase
MGERVVIGMSGGVDSSLSALLLQEQGHEVVGVTLKLWPCGVGQGDDPEDACCSPTDARAVAVGHGMRHYVVDFEEHFRRGVLDEFISAYAGGETPNPCIRCNETVKFGDLWQWSRELGASALATGHYARIETISGRRCPAVPRDANKDQTYFLFGLSQEQLAVARFPLGGLTKDEVRAEAARRGLVNAERADSQDLCFVGPGGLAEFLRAEAPDAFVPGEIRLSDGRVLGEHQGLPAFTVGQRKGIGVAWTEPLYVIGSDSPDNALILGTRDELTISEAWLRDGIWHLHEQLPALGLECLVRHRHRATPVPAVLTPVELADGRPGVHVRYSRPVQRPALGQACVAYDADLRLCLGGGWFTAGPR